MRRRSPWIRSNASGFNAAAPARTLPAGKPSETVQGPRLDLAHAFLRDPQIRANLAQSLLVNSSDPESADEDPPLAVVEPSEQARDDPLSPILGELLFDRVGTQVHGVPDDREACGHMSIAQEAVPSNAPELVPDRPGGVGAE